MRDLRILMQQVATHVAPGLLFAVFQKDPWSCDLCDLLPLKIPYVLFLQQQVARVAAVVSQKKGAFTAEVLQ